MSRGPNKIFFQGEAPIKIWNIKSSSAVFIWFEQLNRRIFLKKEKIHINMLKIDDDRRKKKTSI